MFENNVEKNSSSSATSAHKFRSFLGISTEFY